MAKMFIKTVALSLENNPISWDDNAYLDIIERNIVVGYLLSIKESAMSINLYLLPDNSFYEGDLAAIELTLNDLKNAFLQWLELLITAPNSFQFRNPPLDLWLETRLNWINALCVKVHQKFGTDVSEALSTAYMTILRLYNKTSVYIGNLHYLEIAIFTAVKKEHAYMRNRLTGGHPNAIHLDATPGEFTQSLANDVTSFHEIITAPAWDTEEEQRYAEIWEKMKADMRRDFSEREIEQICKGSAYMAMPLYRRLLEWRKKHSLEDYL